MAYTAYQSVPFDDLTPMLQSYVKIKRDHLKHGPLTCSALRGGECQIYDQRPGICRLYGLIKLLQCQHGCEPERWLSEGESRQFLKSIEALKKGKSVLTCDREVAMIELAIVIKR